MEGRDGDRGRGGEGERGRGGEGEGERVKQLLLMIFA